MKIKDLKTALYITEKQIEENEVYLKSLEAELENFKITLTYSKSYTERQKVYDQSVEKKGEIDLCKGKLGKLYLKQKELNADIQRKEKEYESERPTSDNVAQ